MDALGKRLADGIRAIFERAVCRMPSCSTNRSSILSSGPGPPNRNYDDALAADKRKYAAYYHEMRTRKILLPPRRTK